MQWLQHPDAPRPHIILLILMAVGGSACTCMKAHCNNKKLTGSLTHAGTCPACSLAAQIRTDIIKGTLQPKFLKDCRLLVNTPEADVLRVRAGAVHASGNTPGTASSPACADNCMWRCGNACLPHAISDSIAY